MKHLLAWLLILCGCAEVTKKPVKAFWKLEHVSVLVDSSMPSKCQHAVQEALNYWYPTHGYMQAQSVPHDNIAVAGLPRYGEIGISQGPLSPGLGGETYWQKKGDEMISASIVLADCTPHVATHELGHALGFLSEGNGIMAPYYSPDEEWDPFDWEVDE